MVNEAVFDGGGVIPSDLLVPLRLLVGCRIVDVIRFSWWAPEEAQQECGLTSEEVFSLTAGPVAITFDSGVVMGVSSNPSTNSVSVWMERDKSGSLVRSDSLMSDEELHPISAKDQKFSCQFWYQVVGARVDAVSILVRRPATARLEELPNEVGLCFLLDSGEKFVAAHGLHDDSDDFVIIPEGLIWDVLHTELEEIRV
ncbi:hypothetical protein FBY21_0788 [Pseudomonas sp. SLBN-26]|uniref:hypothetical protein n=1 Tax=Pseudomonadaceae TaxID=135621 RepID=UPI00114E05DE|nr:MULTISPECIES: hypothetical protein [Pseudomonas]MCP1616176.1 hypothetical protein [Pseudomonas otitidis]TQL05440.1 hypothetical protein FBY21_0788 [Pseudomonas sp. SLBN-26]